MKDLPKAPAGNIKYGMIQNDCVENFKVWIGDLLEFFKQNPDMKKEVVNELYDELVQLGYNEGSDYADMCISEN